MDGPAYRSSSATRYRLQLGVEILEDRLLFSGTNPLGDAPLLPLSSAMTVTAVSQQTAASSDTKLRPASVPGNSEATSTPERQHSDLDSQADEEYTHWSSSTAGRRDDADSHNPEQDAVHRSNAVGKTPPQGPSAVASPGPLVYEQKPPVSQPDADDLPLSGNIPNPPPEKDEYQDLSLANTIAVLASIACRDEGLGCEPDSSGGETSVPPAAPESTLSLASPAMLESLSSSQAQLQNAPQLTAVPVAHPPIPRPRSPDLLEPLTPEEKDRPVEPGRPSSDAIAAPGKDLDLSVLRLQAGAPLATLMPLDLERVRQDVDNFFRRLANLGKEPNSPYHAANLAVWAAVAAAVAVELARLSGRKHPRRTAGPECLPIP